MFRGGKWRESGEANRLKGGWERHGEAGKEPRKEKGDETRSEMESPGVNSGGRGHAIYLYHRNTSRNYALARDESVQTCLNILRQLTMSSRLAVTLKPHELHLVNSCG